MANELLTKKDRDNLNAEIAVCLDKLLAHVGRGVKTNQVRSQISYSSEKPELCLLVNTEFGQTEVLRIGYEGLTYATLREAFLSIDLSAIKF